MEALVDAGLVRAIGISNFSLPQVEALLASCRIKPDVLQVWRRSEAPARSDELRLGPYCVLYWSQSRPYCHCSWSLQIELHPLLAQRKLVGVLFRKVC